MTWGKKETPVRFIDRWNPFSSKVPSATFASHLLVRRKKVIDSRLTIESAVPEFEKAIVDFWKQNGQIQEVCVTLCVVNLILYLYRRVTETHNVLVTISVSQVEKLLLVILLDSLHSSTMRVA